MTPANLKSFGYLVSTVSVALLGWTAWPGAQKAGLIPVLIGGMIASVIGMACRWWSYELDKRAQRKAPPNQDGRRT